MRISEQWQIEQDEAESQTFEIDESPPQVPRIDSPVQLENRGLTQPKNPQYGPHKPEDLQFLLWSKQTIHKNTTAAKLREAGRADLAASLEFCHTVFTVAQCTKCGQVQKFPNRCDRFFCAECQPRLSADRKKAVEWWTREIQQPKHVTLTCKNVPDLTQGHVQQFRKWFTNLRRTKFARNWIGGFYSFEVTNEGNGWHLHLHALINARYIDQFQLSEHWQKVTNGMGRIVNVRDARGKNYLAEVTKYAVKGVQLAAWSGQQICTFIDAFSGVRTFGVFGDLYGKRTQFAEWFKEIRNKKPTCSCGNCTMLYFSEAQFLEKDFLPNAQVEAIPPPVAIQHPELFALSGHNPPK